MVSKNLTVLCLSGMIIGASPRNVIKDPVSTARLISEYKNRVQELTSCADLKRQSETTTNAITLMARIGDSVGNKPKSEYETTEQYSARTERFWDQAVGGLRRLIIKSPVKVYTKYDADRGRLTLEWLLTGYGDIQEMTLRSTRTPTGSYSASNAFGVSVQVTKGTISQTKLVLDQKDLSDENYSQTPIFKVPLTPDQARLFEIKPMFLIWADLKAPYLVTKHRRSGATIDNPNDFTFTDREWYVQIKCMFLISNNKIIGSLKE